MRIVDVETHRICPPFHAWNDRALSLFHGSDFRYRTIYVVRTDNGLEGLGGHIQMATCSATRRSAK